MEKNTDNNIQVFAFFFSWNFVPNKFLRADGCMCPCVSLFPPNYHPVWRAGQGKRKEFEKKNSSTWSSS